MASRTRSHTTDSIPTFEDQHLPKEPEKEVCSFDNADIAALRASGAFPADAIIRPFDREVRSDVSSTNGYAQTMPMVWRVLVLLEQIKSRHFPDLCIEDLPVAYRFRSHGNNPHFKELAPPSAESEQRIKDIYRLTESEKTFSLSFASSNQRSSSDMSLPVINLEGFQLEELDSYSGPVQVKQEANPKPAVTSKPTSSKAAAVPKPSTTSKPRNSSSRKRKEPDSPAASNLVFVSEDSCGLNKMLEAKLKKAETTMADQAAIATAKSEHYEAKYKAMTLKYQASIKKITHEAQAKSDAAQVQHEQDMASYREGLKNSVPPPI
ncbi:hypothetical protein Hanom_Chr07g00627931 [Helianthus anomalus]